MRRFNSGARVVVATLHRLNVDGEHYLLARASGGYGAHLVPQSNYESDGREAAAACGFAPSGGKGGRSMIQRHGWRPIDPTAGTCGHCLGKVPGAKDAPRDLVRIDDVERSVSVEASS